jgi:hypothetical protein
MGAVYGRYGSYATGLIALTAVAVLVGLLAMHTVRRPAAVVR